MEKIVETINNENPCNESQRRSRGVLPLILSFGATFLPIGGCPACWPVYAGLLSSIGLGFLLESTYLFPLTALLLAVAVVSIAHGAKSRRGYLPLALSVAAVVGILVGKFALSSDSFTYVSLFLFVGASFWNAWPRKKTETGYCKFCA